MAKTGPHRRNGTGHKLHGRRRGQKTRALLAAASGYFKPKHWTNTPSTHVPLETRLVLVSETPDA